MQKEIELLELDKIKNKLLTLTVSPWGKENVNKLYPDENFDSVNTKLEEVTEACYLLRSGTVPLSGSEELRHFLQRTNKGGNLEPREVYLIGNFLDAVRRIKMYFLGEGINDLAPYLYSLAKKLKNLPVLEKKITNCISQGGEVRDHASPTLTQIRNQIKAYKERIREMVESYLRNESYHKFLQELLITIRNERYVLPVKQEHRNHIPGIVHDQSTSGATLFIEPLPVVELYNKLNQLKIKERQEINRVLSMLTSQIKLHEEYIKENIRIYGYIDFTMARGRLSIQMEGCAPRLNKEGLVDIKEGRHPLLKKKIIPINIYIGNDFTVLVITGPNTGGKTVTLKTIGLFCLMAQCGLHIPAGEGTSLSVFEGIYADIGDEQNIEQSLSTFSGHMQNIAHILKKANAKSLVLLDELGAGTDPSEGAALGMALLDELHRRGSRVVATTHYSELKYFAHLCEGMQNASMEFDTETLSPSFRVLIGIPGRSNAFTIAENLGLSSNIISKAKNYMSKEEIQAEEMIVRLNEEYHRIVVNTKEIVSQRSRIEKIKEELEKEKREIENKRHAIFQKAREEARMLINQTKRSMNEIIKELEKAKGFNEHAQRSIIEKSRRRLHGITSIMKSSVYNYPKQGSCLKCGEIERGMFVYVRSIGQRGKIMDYSNDYEDVQIQVRGMRINTRIKDLEIIEQLTEGATKVGETLPALVIDKNMNISSQVDFRGLSLDEAIERVDKYLDDSFLAGLEQVILIHGKGTGKLRRGLQDFLKEHNQVESFRMGAVNEGGSGVTVVKIKK